MAKKTTENSTQKKTAKINPKQENIRKNTGRKPDHIETPEETVDRVLSGFFTECKTKLDGLKKEDFSIQGIRAMLALRAGLFIEQEIREPSAEPTWFAVLLFKWAFPEEAIKVSRNDEPGNNSDVIEYHSHIPRPEPYA